MAEAIKLYTYLFQFLYSFSFDILFMEKGGSQVDFKMIFVTLWCKKSI